MNLNKNSPVHDLRSCILNIQFNVIFPFMHTSSKQYFFWSTFSHPSMLFSSLLRVSHVQQLHYPHLITKITFSLEQKSRSLWNFLQPYFTPLFFHSILSHKSSEFIGTDRPVGRFCTKRFKFYGNGAENVLWKQINTATQVLRHPLYSIFNLSFSLLYCNVCVHQRNTLYT